MQILACCPVSSGYTMHWLCEQDKHTHTICTRVHTCQGTNADMESGCSTCAVMSNDLKIKKKNCSPITNDCFSTDLWSREDNLEFKIPHSCMSHYLQSVFSGSTESAFNHSKSHFHNSIGKSKNKGVELLKWSIHYCRAYIINKSLCPTPTQTCIYDGQA